jgi:hypothetical protein
MKRSFNDFFVRAILIICVLVGSAPVTFFIWYRWDSAHNWGFEFGYWGVFNRFRHALAKLPGITITDDWAHEDSDFEEFSFDIITGDGRALSLFFNESDPARRLSGQPLVTALISRIEQQAPANENPR